MAKNAIVTGREPVPRTELTMARTRIRLPDQGAVDLVSDLRQVRSPDGQCSRHCPSRSSALYWCEQRTHGQSEWSATDAVNRSSGQTSIPSSVLR
jgi:hypothetical protein